MKLQLIAIRKWGQTALYSAAGVLGIAVVLGMSEPAPASAAPVTPESVQIVSEKMLKHNTPAYGKWAKASKSKIRG